MLGIFTESSNKFRNLRILNLSAGILHLIQGIVMVTISNDTKVTLTTSFLKASGIPQEGTFSIFTNTENFVTFELGKAVAIFLFLSALAHFLVSTPGIFEWYKKNLEKGINYARWIEYSLSASWMIFLIGTLTGIFDFPSLILLFGLNSMMILFGWVMEKHNQLTTKTDWTSYIFGCIAGIIPWIIIAWYFISAIEGYDPGENGNPVPKFVYAILISIFVFFNIFALNMFMQYKKIGPWKNYLFGEVVYIILSLVAKSLLAWQVWSGTLRG